MRDVDKHLKQEYEDWEKVQAKELTKLNAAMRHLCLNVGAYFLISIIEWILASISHSQTLRADAFNNLSGVISTSQVSFLYLNFPYTKQVTISASNSHVFVMKRSLL